MTAETRLSGSYAVILAGGGGTRLWPLSRRARPKPFLPLLGEESLFQRTLARIEPLIDRSAIYVVAEERLLPLAAEQAPWLSGGQLLSEPIGRNTAAAVALAALAIERPVDDVMLVLPADAYIADERKFRDLLALAAGAAADGSFVTLGGTPTGPDTGFGYIVGAEPDGAVRRVERFVEKPAREQAMELLASPNGAWWNVGIVVWRRDALLEGLERHAPAVIGSIRRGLDAGQSLTSIYEDLPSVSIDHAVLEAASLEGRVRVVPAAVGWSDVGSWNALHAELARLKSAQSDVLAIGRNEDVGSEDVLVHSSSGRLVVTVGLRGTIVVDTPDVLLVCDAQRAQEVRSIVDRLVQAKETEYL